MMTVTGLIHLLSCQSLKEILYPIFVVFEDVLDGT
jgi:hypothetical protein